MARQTRVKANLEQAAVWAHPADEHESDFRALMLWMACEGQRAFRERRDGASLYTCVDQYFDRGAWYLVSEQGLEKFLDDGALNPDNGRRVPCVVLKPIEEFHILPVLVPKFVFRREHNGRTIEVYPEIRLRVALFYEDANKAVRVLGYRFEVPEGRPNDTGLNVGMHDYSHFQYITGFRKNDTFNELAAELPPHAPAWPVRASDPASMLATVFVGLYGKRAAFACPEKKLGKLLTDFASGMICSPDPICYKIERCEKERLRSDYVVMWDRQKEYVECHLRNKFNVADNDKVLTLVERTKVLLDSKPYEVFWNIHDLP